jgi:hypothetical protein
MNDMEELLKLSDYTLTELAETLTAFGSDHEAADLYSIVLARSADLITADLFMLED